MFYRVAAGAGLACAALLVFNTFRRAGVVPENAVTHAVAPFAPLTGLLVVTGMYLLIRRTAGRIGAVGYVLNMAGLAGAFAVEYVLHFVFPLLGGGIVRGLLGGGTGRAFLVTSVVLIVGVLAFGAVALRAGVFPVPAVLLYMGGMVPGALRNVVPEPVYLGGLLVAAAGVAWLATRLWGVEEDRAAPAVTSTAGA
ncbi:hypothetical protein DP939_18720 [Spongiactinospora rosea]|uniref:Uncharacterized protein n=1 Tax=Spongiactinospora rosea TaxID=2248750 RepID=A0A366LX39_9ACTN|nr:hypothetical protein [Spongiactinospora rosea]RBQ18536.1 hypothetical protein DP939_18720 [Spongiactinospora rosea]